MSVIGLEIGPKLVRGVVVGPAPRMAHRAVEGSDPSGAAAQVLKDLGARGSAVRIALMPPYVDGRTARQTSSLAALLRETKLDPQHYTFVATPQKGMHEGDHYVSFANKEFLGSLAQATRRSRARLEQVVPWFLYLPFLGEQLEPSLKDTPRLHVDVRQDTVTFLATIQGRHIELVAHFPFTSRDDLFGRIETLYAELADERPIVITSDDRALISEFASLAGDSSTSIVYPANDDAFQRFGAFGLAHAAAIADVAANLFSEDLQRAYGPKTLPVQLLIPPAIALVIMAGGFMFLDGQKQMLERQEASFERQIAAVADDAARAQRLAAEIEYKRRTLQTIDNALFAPKWTDRLKAFYGRLRPDVAASRITFGEEGDANKPSISTTLIAFRAASLLESLSALERAYPSAHATAITRHKIGDRNGYTISVDVEANR